MSQFQSATWTESGLRRVQANVVLRLRNASSAQLLRKAENQERKFRKRPRDEDADESNPNASIFTESQLDSEFSINFEFMWLKRFEDLVSQNTPTSTSTSTLTLLQQQQKSDPSFSAGQSAFLVPNPYRRKGTSLHPTQSPVAELPTEPNVRPQPVTIKNGPQQLGLKDMKGEGSTVTVKTLGIFRLPPKLPWFDDMRSTADLFFLSRCRVEPELLAKAKAAVEKVKNTQIEGRALPPSQTQRLAVGKTSSKAQNPSQNPPSSVTRGRHGFPEAKQSQESEVFQIEKPITIGLPQEGEDFLDLDGPRNNTNARKRAREAEVGGEDSGELAQYVWDSGVVPEFCARVEGLAMSNRRLGLVNGTTPFPSVVGPGMLNLPPYGLIAFGRARLQIPTKPAAET